MAADAYQLPRLFKGKYLIVIYSDSSSPVIISESQMEFMMHL